MIAKYARPTVRPEKNTTPWTFRTVFRSLEIATMAIEKQTTEQMAAEMRIVTRRPRRTRQAAAKIEQTSESPPKVASIWGSPFANNGAIVRNPTAQIRHVTPIAI